LGVTRTVIDSEGGLASAEVGSPFEVRLTATPTAVSKICGTRP